MVRQPTKTMHMWEILVKLGKQFLNIFEEDPDSNQQGDYQKRGPAKVFLLGYAPADTLNNVSK